MHTRMNFGKHRGKLLGDVPSSYLIWVLKEAECVEPWLREEIIQELQARGYRRKGCPDPEPDCGPSSAGPRAQPPADWSTIIRRWHRDLVLQHHPDRGGDVKVMQALNDACDRLKQLVGVA